MPTRSAPTFRSWRTRAIASAISSVAPCLLAAVTRTVSFVLLSDSRLPAPGSFVSTSGRAAVIVQVNVRTSMASSRPIASLDLYWLPLGAGGHSVRLNGAHLRVGCRAAETARPLRPLPLRPRGARARGTVRDRDDADPPSDGAERGVVAEGAVGARAAGRFRLFRYEVRRWRDGVIPDLAEAVESPRRLSTDSDCTRRLLELVPQVPTPVWGRDELHARRDVELELAHLVAYRARRARYRVDPPAARRKSPRLARRHRDGAPPQPEVAQPRGGLRAQ